MSNSTKDIAKRLRVARERAGYKTASDAARALDITESTYMAHENGSRGFASNAARYARFFDVSADWLLMGRGDQELGDLLKSFRKLPQEKQRDLMQYLDYLRSKNG